jgi:hypothetical protein
MRVHAHVTHAWDTPETNDLTSERHKITAEEDWEIYDTVDGSFAVDLEALRQPTWLVFERISDSAMGDITGTLKDGSGMAVFRDESATLYLKRGLTMGEVADYLDLGRGNLKFPANLPVNVAVLDHETGVAHQR